MDQRNNNAFKALKLLGVPKEEVFVSQRYLLPLDQVRYRTWQGVERTSPDFSRSGCSVTHRTTLMSITGVPPGRAERRAATVGRALQAVFASRCCPRRNGIAETVCSDSIRRHCATLDRKVAAMAAYEGEMRSAPHPRSRK